MEVDDVIATLEAPTGDRRGVMNELQATAPPAVLAETLARAERPLTRQLAADLLGRQAAPDAATALLVALGDPSPGVRSSAADALGKVMLAHGPVPEAGPALLRAYDAEPDTGPRHMMAAALGAAHHREAIPLLRAAAAQQEDRGLAHTAGWALEQLERG